MVSSHRMGTMRRLVAVVFLIACVATVFVSVVAVGSFLLNPFAGFDGGEEFADLSGAAAKHRLRNAWPPAVDSASVRSVNFKTQWSRDSHSSWYRVKLTKDAAKGWANHIHSGQERDSKAALHNLHKRLDGVHRSITGPPPLHKQTGSTPAWWSPPKAEFRATEIMMWYTHGDSGVGRATYSGFDESTDTLWVYDYACQHDQLWSPGNAPQGGPIQMTEKR